MAREIKKIDFPTLKKQVDDGWKREQIAEHWGLTIAATRRLLKDANLRLRPTRYPVYELVGLETEDSVTDVTEEIIEDTVENTLEETSTEETTNLEESSILSSDITW